MQPNSNPIFSSDTHFEVEIRRIAGMIWPAGKVQRSPTIDGRERDALIQTPDLVFVVEATTSRRKDKIAEDAKKTNALVRKIRSQGFSCQGIIVTLYEPTAEQEAANRQYTNAVSLQSFDQFLSRLFDASQYLHVRVSKPFGSIQNPADSHFELDRNYYIPVPILEDQTGGATSAHEIGAAILESGARFAIFADFGSGKSMALREVFFWLRDEFLQKKHLRFPVYINLRDHAGAKYPDEILERHARDLGLADYSQLVKAWRAGFVDLLLDGFDEFAATGWTAMPIKLRQIRRTMLEAVRRLIAESPKSVGIVIVGRQHYFDSLREMRDALSLSERFKLLRIDLLSEDDAAKIVRKYGGASVPDWVPSRALLLAYLAAKHFLREIPADFLKITSRGHGWDALLQMICNREASHHPAIDGASVLAFLERLASIARRTPDGLGAFSETDLSNTFEQACGFPPDDAARVLISRLPALASLAPETGRRRFIDPDIADASRAGDVLRFINAPYDVVSLEPLKDAQCAMGGNGLERLSYIAERAALHEAKVQIACEHAGKLRSSIVTLDVLQLMMDWGLNYERSGIDISEIQFDNVTFEEPIPDFSHVRFINCLIDSLFLGQNVSIKHLPKFSGCLIGSLDGIAAIGDLPKDAFIDCEIQAVSNSLARNAGILDTDLPVATKVLLTILNKLFNQAGRGRKENAFSRGLDTRARALVPQILDFVVTFGFATPTRIRQQTIWLPRRDKSRRVAEILNKPATSKDPLLDRTRSI